MSKTKSNKEDDFEKFDYMKTVKNNINNVIKENTQAIRDITDKSYASKIKKNSRNNMNGALLGGGIGILIGVASRQNFYITGLIGLIIGRLFITNLMKK